MAGLKCEGGQLVLKGLQRRLAHSSLWELVPQLDRSGEEAMLITGE